MFGIALSDDYSSWQEPCYSRSPTTKLAAAVTRSLKHQFPYPTGRNCMSTVRSLQALPTPLLYGLPKRIYSILIFQRGVFFCVCVPNTSCCNSKESSCRGWYFCLFCVAFWIGNLVEWLVLPWGLIKCAGVIVFFNVMVWVWVVLFV